jgi:hypothetical protein
MAGSRIFYSDSQVVIGTIPWCRLVVRVAELLIAFQTDCARRWFAQNYNLRQPGNVVGSPAFGRIVNPSFLPANPAPRVKSAWC